MTTRSLMVVAAVALIGAGCATGPKTALRPRILKADHVVYFEQSDRVPKDVLLAAHGKQDAVVAAMSSIPQESIEKVIEKLIEVIPALSKNYTEERMYNALLGRRMLFIGYETPEQLEKVKEIVDSMGGSIEYLTPRGDDAVPGE